MRTLNCSLGWLLEPKDATRGDFGEFLEQVGMVRLESGLVESLRLLFFPGYGRRAVHCQDRGVAHVALDALFAHGYDAFKALGICLEAFQGQHVGLNGIIRGDCSTAVMGAEQAEHIGDG